MSTIYFKATNQVWKLELLEARLTLITYLHTAPRLLTRMRTGASPASGWLSCIVADYDGLMMRLV